MTFGPYNQVVSGMLYDVFVVGAKDPSPVAQMHLAAALAKHFQAPVADVSQAITSRNLRAGKSLDDAQARVLSQQLAAMGAETELRPSMAGPRPRHPTQTGGKPQTGEGTIPTLATLVTSPNTDVVGRDPFASHTALPAALPTVATGPHHVTHAQSGPHSIGGHMTGVATGGHLPSVRPGGGPGTRPGTQAAAAPRGAGGARDAFGAPEENLPRLELARPTGTRATAETSDVLPKPRTSLPGSSGMDHMRLASSGDSGVSGVEAAGDHNKSHMQRCAKHGLYYDQRMASGCRKCLEPAKQLARKIERNALGFKLMALRDNPARRASWGLGMALALGFIPAAWHALTFGRPEISALRAEQAVLSQKVGTEETIRQYHEIDKRVHESHSKHRRNTGLLWVVVAGGALVGWYRLT